GERSIRQLAADIFVQKISQQLISATKIGEVIGKLERDEYGPLKRLTDLIEQQMLRVTATHNQALIKMLEAFFAELSITKLRNLKRLLEIYHELLVQAGRSPQEPNAIAQIHIWAEQSATKAIAKKILAL
ncbi:MAG: DUF6493 family protein, partial [Bacteroidota bacterium]